MTDDRMPSDYDESDAGEDASIAEQEAREEVEAPDLSPTDTWREHKALGYETSAAEEAAFDAHYARGGQGIADDVWRRQTGRG